jgi:hypothetical protein
VVCGTTNADSTTCGTGTCQPDCKAGWGDCTSPELGCTVPLGTTTHCTACGDSCTGSTPFCDPGGCVHFRDIVVGTTAHGIGGWNGNQGAAQLGFQHTISWPRGENRMLVMGVATTDNYLEPYSVTYDGKAMNLAESIASATQSWAGVYYLLDADLPVTPTLADVLVRFDSGNAWGHGGYELMELKNVQQAEPFASGTGTGDNCGGGFQARSVSVSYTSPGEEPTKYNNSLVYGVMAARGSSQMAVTLTSGGTQSWYEYQAAPDQLVGTSVRAFDNDSHTFNWTVLPCYNTAQVAVAIQRLTGPP